MLNNWMHLKWGFQLDVILYNGIALWPRIVHEYSVQSKQPSFIMGEDKETSEKSKNDFGKIKAANE